MKLETADLLKGNHPLFLSGPMHQPQAAKSGLYGLQPLFEALPCGRHFRDAPGPVPQLTELALVRIERAQTDQIGQ